MLTSRPTWLIMLGVLASPDPGLAGAPPGAADRGNCGRLPWQPGNEGTRGGNTGPTGGSPGTGAASELRSDWSGRGGRRHRPGHAAGSPETRRVGRGNRERQVTRIGRRHLTPLRARLREPSGTSTART